MTVDDQNTRMLTVLVGVDYSDVSALALVEATATAQRRAPSHLHGFTPSHMFRQLLRTWGRLRE